MKVDVDAQEAIDNLKEFMQKRDDALIKAMRRSMQQVGIVSARDYLHGPRPDHLDIKSGKLIRAVMGGYGFGGGLKETGSRSVSSKDGFQTVKKSGDHIVGEMGVNPFTPFDYPKMWELTGRKAFSQTRKTKSGREYTIDFSAQKPRPFLNPAAEDAHSRGIIDDIFQEELDNLKAEI